MSDPTQRFRAAESAFRRGEYDTARTLLIALLDRVGEHEAVLHLLAIVERAGGRPAAAAAAFDRALRTAPGNAQIRNGYANLLIANGDLEGALDQLDRILRSSPHETEIRINRAIVRRRIGKPRAAKADIDEVRARRPDDARVQALSGAISLDLGDLEAAEIAFDRALDVEPGRASALAGRARLALERGDADAEWRHQEALKHGADDRDLSLSRILSAEANGDIDRAVAMAREAVAIDPFWLAAQNELARMASETGEADIYRAYRWAATMPNAPIDIVRGYLGALSMAQRSEEVLAFGISLSPEARADPAFRVLHAAALSESGGDGADAAIEQVELLPGGEITASRHWLRRGAPDRAAALLEPMTRADVRDVSRWAYLGVAWRLLGDPRTEWLYHQPALYGAETLALSSATLAELADLLRGLHHARAHPLGQSMRGGTQTRGNLLWRREPMLKLLSGHLDAAIKRHVAALPSADPRHPLLCHRDGSLGISGSWSVRLTGSGYHVSHIHPQGVLSSALYIVVPDAATDVADQPGWLELGRPPIELDLALEPIATIEPQAGRLALFPSYLFHGTRPFEKGERLSVAFDVSATD